MTRDSGNIGIFRQMRSFSKVLIVWEARVGVLTVCRARSKTDGNLKN
jgi:hypothetical protein